jgi:hypothetical protein
VPLSNVLIFLASGVMAINFQTSGKLLSSTAFSYNHGDFNDIVTCWGVTYKIGFGLDDWIYCTLYIHTVWDYRQYSAIAILHTFQFTITHALGFPVFTSRILATELSQSHCNFKSHTKSSWHRLIPFLPFLLISLRMPSPELTQFSF